MNLKAMFWKRIAMVAVVASFVALAAAPAFAQERHNWRDRLNIDLDDYDWGDIRDRLRDRYEERRRPVSSVPEPSAALLFAGGGLIVAQAIRSNRRKKQ